MAEEMRSGSGKRPGGHAGLKHCSKRAASMSTDYDDWRKIEEAETANARARLPAREVRRIEHWLQTPAR